MATMIHLTLSGSMVAGGTIGAILTGVLAVSAVNPIFKKSKKNLLASGLIEGNPHQLMNQLARCNDCLGLGIVGTLAILFVVDNSLASAFPQSRKMRVWTFRNTGRKGITGRLSVTLVLRSQFRHSVKPSVQVPIPVVRFPVTDQKSGHAHTIPTRQ